MTQRVEHPKGFGRRTSRRSLPPPPARYITHDPVLLGFPVELADDDEPVTDERLVVVRRADPFGGVVLLLAGLAAGVGVALPWTQGGDAVGLTLYLRGIVFGSAAEVLTTGLWQPLVVFVSGVLLLGLGLLMLRPARTHRVVGVVALALAIAAATAVLGLLSEAGWRTTPFGIGWWFGVAVPVLGVLGAMKAMLTSPRVTIGTRRPG